MSAQRDLGQSMLQVIFSFFLGLMVTGFVGVGVNTFYPPPDDYTQRDQYRMHQLTTSIVLLLVATGIMLLALALADVGVVLANGALLGGLFTMVYAVGVGVTTDYQWPRFAVLTFALAVTVAVGWWKFSRGRRTSVPVGAPAGGGLSAEGEARLAAVEAKLDAVARALRD